jgi:dTDP-4-dehydrorhamnose reductase
MQVLILGGSGMLGHKLSQIAQTSFDVHVTLRQSPPTHHLRVFENARLINGVGAEDFDSVAHAVDVIRPDVIVNCIGIVKQSDAAKDPIASITVNSLFPHRLAQLAREHNARLIHLSTDCVYSGSKGIYSEDDLPDAHDLYGRTKVLGEVSTEKCLTLRTSMIGRELAHTRGLLEWFLAQNGREVRGFRRAIFSGLTTLALAEIIVQVISSHPGLHGIWHVAGPATSKFDLLSLVQKTYGLNIRIQPDETFVCDRSLTGSRFEAATGIRAPSWAQMIQRMHADPTPYDAMRRTNDS